MPTLIHDTRMSHNLNIRLLTRRATRKLGYAIASALNAGDLVVLEGDLGAGKTFLVRAIARALGVSTEVPITSPTFELIHELPARLPLIHADLYRLEAPEQLVELGLIDRIGKEAVALVEWGEKFATELGDEGLWIRLRFTEPPTGRLADLSARGPRGEALLARIEIRLAAQEPVPTTLR